MKPDEKSPAQTSEPSAIDNATPAGSGDRAPFRLDRWRVVPAELRLVVNEKAVSERADGEEEVRLQQKEMTLLLALCDAGDKPLSSEEVRQLVWGDQAITDGAAKNLVWQLRRSLGETAQEPRLIETVPGAGYRLTVAPQALDGAANQAGAAPTIPTDSTDSSRRLPRQLVPLALGAFVLLALLAFFRFAAQRGSGSAGETVTLVARPVTGLPGREAEIELDPTGRHLLFSWSEEVNGQADLYRFDLQDPDATPLRLTATDELWEVGGRFSPDGRRIAFVSGVPNGEELTIQVVPATGGAAKTVTTLRSGIEPELAWAGDGETLFLTWWPDFEVGHRIHRLSLSGGEPEPLFEPPDERAWDRTPAVSPDGRLLAFSRWTAPHTGELRLLELGAEGRTGNERVVAVLAGTLGTLDWSSDGKALLFTSRREGKSSTVYRVPVGEKSPAVPTLFAPTAGSLDIGEVTVGGDTVAFEQSVYDLDILRFELPEDLPAYLPDDPVEGLAEGGSLPGIGEPRRVAISDRADFAPQLSPDGRRLAFLSDRSGGFELWLMDGEKTRRLPVPGVVSSSHPRWSPDGQLIALSVVRDGQRDLVVVRPGEEAGGDHIESVTETPEREMLPSWRPDGLALRFFVPGGEPGTLWEQELWNPENRRLLAEKGQASVAPEPGLLLFSHGGDGVFRLEVGGNDGETVDPKAAPQLLDVPIDGADWANWDASKDGIFSAAVASRKVHFLRFSDGAAFELLELEQPVARYGLDVSADGRTLFVVSVVRDTSRILTLEKETQP